MVSRVQYTIKIKFYSGIKFTYQSQQRNLNKLKKQDSFNKIYNGDGEPGTFCDMEDIADTQYFDEYALPDFFLLDTGKSFSDYECNEYFSERGDKLNHY